MVLYAYVTPGCFLYMHTPICYYLSLQLAILLNCKLLKIAIIRTKMWSLKIIQYDLICCAEQLTNNICIPKQVLYCYCRSCIPISITSQNPKYYTEEKQTTFEQLHCLLYHKTTLFFTVVLLLHPQRKESKDQELCIGVIPSLYFNIFINLCFINICRNSWKKKKTKSYKVPKQIWQKAAA